MRRPTTHYPLATLYRANVMFTKCAAGGKPWRLPWKESDVLVEVSVDVVSDATLAEANSRCKDILIKEPPFTERNRALH